MGLCLKDPAEIDESDDLLVARYRAGDPRALDVLLHRYRRFARAKARSYYLVGADPDDIEQEGMIGLYKAVRDYRPEREAGFRSFAELCVTRHIISAVKAANRQKHQPMHRYVSISGGAGGESEHERSVEVLLGAHHEADPADVVCQQERMAAMQATMRDMLSGLEVEVLRLFAEGRSYDQIGQSLGRHAKSVDNALQRIKKKVEHHVAQHDALDLAQERLVA